MTNIPSPARLRPWDPGATSPSPQSVPVTAIILTLNEELDIVRCIHSLGWCGQILVVDSGSTDATVQLAEAAGAQILTNAFEGYGIQREWALRHPSVRYEWTFFVDADEWVSEALASEIAEAIQRVDVDGFSMHHRLVFQRRWIRYAGWYRSGQLVRLVRRSRARWDGEVSEKLLVDGEIGKLINDLVDEDSKGLEAWLSRHNQYSSLKAKQRVHLRDERIGERFARVIGTRPRSTIPREFAKQLLAPSVPAPGLLRFVYMYFLRGGFLMGKTGLRFCLLHAMQEMHTTMKIDEALAGNTKPNTTKSEPSARL